jgi:hypothetical protein
VELGRKSEVRACDFLGVDEASAPGGVSVPRRDEPAAEWKENEKAP